MPFELSESKSAVVAQMKECLSKLETEEGRGESGVRRRDNQSAQAAFSRSPLDTHHFPAAAGRMKGVNFKPNPDDIMIVSPPK